MSIGAFAQNFKANITDKQRPDKLWNCDSICQVIKNDPCLGLRLLSDSALFCTHVDYRCASRLWRFYGNSTRIHHYFNCDPIPAVSYSSMNMGKSLLKMDLLLWMRYYGCPDSTNLQHKHYGDFSEERDAINRLFEDNSPSLRDFDTTILWK